MRILSAQRLFVSFWVVSLKLAYCSEEVVFDRNVDTYFDGHVIRTKHAHSEIECGSHCARETLCASANFKAKGKNICELNSNVLEEFPDNRIQSTNYVYLGIVYRDLPPMQAYGENCQDTNQIFSTKTKRCLSVKSCKEILEENEHAESGVYTLHTPSKQYDVFCHMTRIPGCRNHAGWTLVMKIDGNKKTFGFDSPYWTNEDCYAVKNGLEGPTEKESKLASYQNTAFEKMCLGMTVNDERRWMMLNYEASSLYSVIAGGEYRKTSAGFEKWASLMREDVFWHQHCKMEGFNGKRGSFSGRIFFASNEPAKCHRLRYGVVIGLGIQFKNDEIAQNHSISVGYVWATEQYSETRVFGYILVS